MPPSHPAAPKDLVGFRIGEDAGSDRRPSTGAIPVDGCNGGLAGVTEVSIPMDLGTIVDTRSARMEALIGEARGKKTRVEGGWVEFCLPSSSRRCSARHGMRGVHIGEASHLGPSSFLRLRRATSVVAVAPTQVDSGRFSASG